MRSILVITGLLLFAAFAPRASAHAFLDHSEPKVGGTIAAPPKVVKLWFTEHLEPAFSTVRVENAEGKQVDKKDAHLDAKNRSLLLVSLPKLPPGRYTVKWRVVSADTHKTEGHFKFTIKAKP